jgi:hypothetical protein
MTKADILKQTGLTEEEFYKKFPTQESFEKFMKGGKLPKAATGMLLGKVIEKGEQLQGLQAAGLTAAAGAIEGATEDKNDPTRMFGSTAGGAARGAASGAMFGPVGMGVGALIGGVSGYVKGRQDIKAEALQDKRSEFTDKLNEQAENIAKAQVGRDTSGYGVGQMKHGGKVYNLFGAAGPYGSSPFYAYGGMTNPEYEAEGGEILQSSNMSNLYGQGELQKNSSNAVKLNGPSHEEGGMPMSTNGEGRIFSDRLKPKGNKKQTFADLADIYTKEIGKIEETEAKNPGEAAKNTAKYMKKDLNAKLDALFEAQETQKAEKEERKAIREFKKGGLLKYPHGGTHLPPEVGVTPGLLMKYGNDPEMAKAIMEGTFNRADFGEELGNVYEMPVDSRNKLSQDGDNIPRGLTPMSDQNLLMNQFLDSVFNSDVTKNITKEFSDQTRIEQEQERANDPNYGLDNSINQQGQPLDIQTNFLSNMMGNITDSEVPLPQDLYTLKNFDPSNPVLGKDIYGVDMEDRNQIYKDYLYKPNEGRLLNEQLLDPEFTYTPGFTDGIANTALGINDIEDVEMEEELSEEDIEDRRRAAEVDRINAGLSASRAGAPSFMNKDYSGNYGIGDFSNYGLANVGLENLRGPGNLIDYDGDGVGDAYPKGPAGDNTADSKNKKGMTPEQMRLASAAPQLVSNLYRGLFGQVDQPFLGRASAMPGGAQALREAGEYTAYNPAAELAANQAAAGRARAQMGRTGNLAALMQGNIAAGRMEGQGASQILGGAERMNVQAANRAQDRRLGMRQQLMQDAKQTELFNLQQRMREQDMYRQNEAAKDAFLQAGLGQLSQVGSAMAADKMRSKELAALMSKLV